VKRSLSRAAIVASSPLAISRTTAVAVGLRVKTFSVRVSNSTPPNFSSRNFTYWASRNVRSLGLARRRVCRKS
jgi:hypothetical protein